MRSLKRAACLCLCFCLLLTAQSAAFAADSAADALEEFFDSYDGLLDGLLSAQGLRTNGRKLKLDDTLSDLLRQYDLSTLGSDLSALLKETAALSDDELDAAIRSVGEAHRISLVDSQVQQLRDLCRTLEKLSPEQLQEKTDELRDRLEIVGDGLDLLEHGKEALEHGKEALEQGKEALEQGKEALEQGKEALEQGKDKLEQGKEKAGGFFDWLKQALRKLGDVLRQLFRLPPRD